MKGSQSMKSGVRSAALSPSGSTRYRLMIQQAFLKTTNLDSLGVVDLLVAIEDEFSVSIDFVTVDPESLLSISGLTHHLSTLVDETNGG